MPPVVHAKNLLQIYFKTENLLQRKSGKRRKRRNLKAEAKAETEAETDAKAEAEAEGTEREEGGEVNKPQCVENVRQNVLKF